MVPTKRPRGNFVDEETKAKFEVLAGRIEGLKIALDAHILAVDATLRGHAAFVADELKLEITKRLPREGETALVKMLVSVFQECEALGRDDALKADAVPRE
jgi:hypothetical protein